MTTQSMQIAIIDNAQNGGLVTMNAKGKAGSFSRAIAFASRESRTHLAAGLMFKYLQNGQYRPLVNVIHQWAVLAVGESIRKSECHSPTANTAHW